MEGFKSSRMKPYTVVREDVLAALKYLLAAQLGNRVCVKRRHLLKVCYKKLGWSRRDTLFPVIVSSVLSSLVRERVPIIVNGSVWEPKREMKRRCCMYVFERRGRPRPRKPSGGSTLPSSGG